MASSRSTSSPGSIDDLNYERQPMVGWFTPMELARAGVRAALSALFGAYADNRELQAALMKEIEPEKGYSEREEIWIDYIADLGDGWAATYTMARLLAEEKLELAHGEEKHATERGSILVMGGDEVYPVANREEYWNRMVGPYRSALPEVADESRAPHLFVIPGNHDWYDGLTSFRRLFCHQRWIGGWRTKQNRSYFALKLPHGWWLWGIDTQLESDVDQPQLDFFHKVAKEMEPGSKIILCCAEPTWLYKKTKGEDAYTNLGYFERKIILKHGHHFTVGLSGDLHSYTRWEQDAGKKQRFVAGGGGAYLYPTHDYPDDLSLPSEEPGEEERYSRKSEDALFPDAGTSRRLAVKSLLFPLKNVSFSAFLGFFYLYFTWIVQSVSVNREGSDVGSLLDKMSALRPDLQKFGGVVEELMNILAHSPGSTVLLALLVIGWIFFADAKSLLKKLLLGGPHAVAHCALMFALMWILAFLNFDPGMLGMTLGDPLPTALFSVEMILAGGFLGGALVGLYLFLANFLFHRHTNEVFLCQSIPDYKNFIRLHIGKDGRLTLYPVGVARVPRDDEYRFVPDSEPGAAWFEPPNGSIGDYAELIEAPVDVGT